MPLIEFVGLPSPLADPVIQHRKATGKVSKKEMQAVWRMEQRRQMQAFARFRGRTILTLTPDKSVEALERRVAKGQLRPEQVRGKMLSRSYTFGPREYTVEMSDEDYEVLLLMHLAHATAFRNLSTIVVAR